MAETDYIYRQRVELLVTQLGLNESDRDILYRMAKNSPPLKALDNMANTLCECERIGGERPIKQFCNGGDSTGKVARVVHNLGISQSPPNGNS